VTAGDRRLLAPGHSGLREVRSGTVQACTRVADKGLLG